MNAFDEDGIMIPFNDNGDLMDVHERDELMKNMGWTYGSFTTSLYAVFNTALFGFGNIESQVI